MARDWSKEKSVTVQAERNISNSIEQAKRDELEDEIYRMQSVLDEITDLISYEAGQVAGGTYINRELILDSLFETEKLLRLSIIRLKQVLGEA